MGTIRIAWDSQDESEKRMLGSVILEIVATAPEVSTPKEDIKLDFAAAKEPQKKELLVDINVDHNKSTRISSFAGLADEVNNFIKLLVRAERLDCVKTQVTAHSEGGYSGVSVWESGSL